MNSDPKCNIFSLKKKAVLQAKLFTVNEVKIDLKNGKKVTHTIAERKPTIAVLPLTKHYELYLVSQYRYLLSRSTLEVMAGFVKENETPLKAAERELKEETGIEASAWEMLGKIEMSASVFHAPTTLYLATGLEMGTPKPDEDEDIEVVKLSLTDAVEKVMNGEINTAASMIGILMLDKLRKEKKL